MPIDLAPMKPVHEQISLLDKAIQEASMELASFEGALTPVMSPPTNPNDTGEVMVQQYEVGQLAGTIRALRGAVDELTRRMRAIQIRLEI